MTGQPRLEIRGLVKRFGALAATDDVSLAFQPNETHAIIGPNGAGKSTLINLITGDLAADAGQIFLEGEDITRLGVARRTLRGLARSFQITELVTGFSALDNVCLAVQGRQQKSFHFFRAASADTGLIAPAQAALAQVGLLHRADDRVETLSHGEKRQLEVAIALALEPKVLLLDEPMAGMGEDETRKMVELLRGLKHRYTILLVEHDMHAVFALADHISVLTAGHVLASDTPESIRRNASVQKAYLGGEL